MDQAEFDAIISRKDINKIRDLAGMPDLFSALAVVCDVHRFGYSQSEVRCLTFYMENRDELDFEWPESDEPRTLKEVIELLSKHPEAEKKVQKEANRILIELSE